MTAATKVRERKSPDVADAAQGKRGIDLLHDSVLNKATAYTEAERQALGLVGLVPDATESEDLQLRRVLQQLGHKSTDLDRYIYLVNLLDNTKRSSIAPSCRNRRASCPSSTIRRSPRPA
jgi:hypothetical protein